MTNQDRSNERIAYWGKSYLDSAEKSHRYAQEFFQCSQRFPEQEENYFTAYLYLFVTFNNLYSFLAEFKNGSEIDRIKDAIGCIPDDDVTRIYNRQYHDVLISLNQRPTEQLPGLRGIVNMRDYFRGKKRSCCVKHIQEIASVNDSPNEKKLTLKNLAAQLLYTVRNNQFHAIKDPITDVNVLRWAYCLLDPIVWALFPVSYKKLELVQGRLK